MMSTLTPCLWLFLTLLPWVTSDLIPRITFKYGDPSRLIERFTQKAVHNYDQLVLSPDGETLYVGARDHLLSFSIRTSAIQLTNQVPWPATKGSIDNCISKAKSSETECFNFIRILAPVNSTHLYTCGTNAFNPACTYLDLEDFSMPRDANGAVLTTDGRSQSPFDPRHKYTYILADGELYTGTMNNFQGNEPIIYRNLGNKTSLKTEGALGWLNSDASFVGSFNPQGSAVDSKIYFFFDETAREYDFFEKMTVARVARVCKNDLGGEKVLQKRWSTFLKAQLTCSLDFHFPFNILQHVTIKNQEDWPTGIFYGVFSTQWQVGGLRSSAVCLFSLDEIEKVFNGAYKEQNKEYSKWTRYMGPVSDPRPGSCTGGKFPDSDLNFMKEHFLMDEEVLPMDKKPVLIKQNVQYTRIATDTVQAVNRHNYTVMFLGTDKGFLHKAVLDGTESHIIEELELVVPQEPIDNLLLVPKKGLLYIGYSAGILQVPLANCNVYQSCFDCILARDPYCAWDQKFQQCKSVRSQQDNWMSWLQDIERGNPNTTCPSLHKMRKPQPNSMPIKENYTRPFNMILELSCPHRSALATYSWRTPNPAGSEGQMLTTADTLVIIVRSDTLGAYECWAVENGYRYAVARYWVSGVSSTGVIKNKGDSDLDGTASSNMAERDFYQQFVVVTVLLVLTLFGCVALALYTWKDKVRTKSKIQGCSTPESIKLSSNNLQEKRLLNGLCDSGGDLSRPCCMPIARPDIKMDLDNNSVGVS
ncbi:hypothetical protein GDO86_019332 [Hymenochirus boettgeri]|uniref:Uncharacterized protein n=1 Tax=Hymenochirus boettgeri TaxID=247094 RepID=A0A8T2IGM3_9PIPI|nr:hypothetical protein GDO86_019332 [Hymenochirus boettgeri]